MYQKHDILIEENKQVYWPNDQWFETHFPEGYELVNGETRSDAWLSFLLYMNGETPLGEYLDEKSEGREDSGEYFVDSFQWGEKDKVTVGVITSGPPGVVCWVVTDNLDGLLKAVRLYVQVWNEMLAELQHGRD
jgi:hypothetical protein